ncbi:MAG TPA: hypothetical protein VGM75_37835 [Pseudonocardiaceae bacterium]
MAFHTADQLHGLGQQVADAAASAVARENPVGLAKGGYSDTAGFYANYPQLYASFATPDPAGMQEALNALQRAWFVLDGKYPTVDPKGTTVPVPAAGNVDVLMQAKLKTPDTIVKDLTGDIGSWKGAAKNAFLDNVLNTLGQQTGNQVAALRILAESLSVAMNLRSTLNQGVWDIGQQTVGLFRKAENPGGLLSSVQVTLDCISAVSACATVWGAVVEATEVTASEAAAAIGALITTSKDATTAVTISGSSPEDVDKSMMNALSKAANAYTSQVAQVMTSLNDLSDAMNKGPQLFTFTIPDSVGKLGSEQVGNPNDPTTLNNEFHD